MAIKHSVYKLQLIDPFGIARSTRTEIDVVHINIDGGLGESSPSKYYGETIKTVTDNLDKVSDKIKPDFEFIEDKIGEIKNLLPENSPSTLAAIDMALYDIFCKKLNIPLYKFIGVDPDKCPKSSFTIGIDTMDIMLQKVDKAAQYPVLKIKLGRDSSSDMKVMKAIREKTNKTLRVDANGGWKYDEAVKCINHLADLEVEFVEQPLNRDDIDGLKKLYKVSKLPIILDENIRVSTDIPKCAEFCHGINIKLMKCGGISEARRMIAVARAFGLKIMIGCMIESSVAITAASHLGPLVDYLDLDGHLLIANDPYQGMIFKDGKPIIPNKPGISVVPRA